MPVISKGLEGIVANSTQSQRRAGEKGQLIYAGYDINELAGRVSYEENRSTSSGTATSPMPRNSQTSSTNLRSRRDLPQGVINFITSAPRKSTPWTSSAPPSPCSAFTTPSSRRTSTSIKPHPRPPHHRKDRRHRRLLPPRPAGQNPPARPPGSRRGRPLPLPP